MLPRGRSMPCRGSARRRGELNQQAEPGRAHALLPPRPFYLVAGLSPSNPLIAGLRQNACGSCLEIECTSGGCHSGVGPLQALITDQCANGCDSSQVRVVRVEGTWGRWAGAAGLPTPACTVVCCMRAHGAAMQG